MLKRQFEGPAVANGISSTVGVCNSARSRDPIIADCVYRAFRLYPPLLNCVPNELLDVWCSGTR